MERKETECRRNFRLQTSDFRDIYLDRIAEKVNQNLTGCVPVHEKYGRKRKEKQTKEKIIKKRRTKKKTKKDCGWLIC